MNQEKRIERWAVRYTTAAVLVTSLLLITANYSLTQKSTDFAAQTNAVTHPAEQRLTADAAAPANIKRSAAEASERDADFTNAVRAALRSEEKLHDQREVFELCYRWIEVDPEQALAFVQSLPFDNSALLIALVNHWARRDPSSAAIWATSLSNEVSRARVIASLTAVWAENAPIEAARFAASLAPGPLQNEAVVTAISGWAQYDPRAALTWASQFPPGKFQEQLYTQVLFAWSQHDAAAAAEWLLGMPNIPGRDAAVSALSGTLVEHHPTLALALAQEIADETIRDRRIENVGRRWLAADRTAAENALIDSDLPANTLARLFR